MNQTKICTTCNIEKELSEFHKQKTGKFGVRGECKICMNSRNKQWRESNPEYIKQYYIDNQESLAEWGKLYYQDNKEAIAATKKQYRQTPAGKAADKAGRHNRRARIKNAHGKHTAKEILELFDLQRGKCPYCKAKLHKAGKNKYHSDHVMPLSKSGSNDISNIQLLCAKCNHTKYNKLPEEFAANFGKLF